MQDQTLSFSNGKEIIELFLLAEPIEYGLVGMASSAMFKERIPIAVDDIPETIEYDFACLAYTKKKTAPRIMLKSDLYEDLKRSTHEALTIIFHELGHYFNEDMLLNDGNSDEEREKLLLDNKVGEKEIKADAFAVNFLGIDSVVDGLEALKARMCLFYDDDYYDKESIQLAVNEIDMRILKIKQNDF